MAMLSPLGEDLFFDVVGLEELTGRKPLATISLYLMHKFNLVKALKLDEDRLQLFLLALEDGYSRTTPYHNNLRAADMVARCDAAPMYAQMLYDTRLHSAATLPHYSTHSTTW